MQESLYSTVPSPVTHCSRFRALCSHTTNDFTQQTSKLYKTMVGSSPVPHRTAYNNLSTNKNTDVLYLCTVACPSKTPKQRWLQLEFENSSHDCLPHCPSCHHTALHSTIQAQRSQQHHANYPPYVPTTVYVANKRLSKTVNKRLSHPKPLKLFFLGFLATCQYYRFFCPLYSIILTV